MGREPKEDRARTKAVRKVKTSKPPKSADCQFCGGQHGVQCPHVKSLEYFPNGKVKRVEFKTARDYYAPQYYWPYQSYPYPYRSFGTTSTLVGTLGQNVGGTGNSRTNGDKPYHGGFPPEMTSGVYG